MEETIIDLVSVSGGQEMDNVAGISILYDERSLITILTTAFLGVLVLMWLLRRCGLNTRGQVSILGIVIGGLVGFLLFVVPPHWSLGKVTIADFDVANWVPSFLLLSPELLNWIDTAFSQLSGGRLPDSAGRIVFIVVIFCILALWVLPALVSLVVAVLKAAECFSDEESENLQEDDFHKMENSFLTGDTPSRSELHPIPSESSMSKGFLCQPSLSGSGISRGNRELSGYDWDGGGDSGALRNPAEDNDSPEGWRKTVTATVMRRVAAAQKASASAAAEREIKRNVILEEKQRRDEERKQRKEARNRQYEEAMEEVKAVRKAIRECKENLRMEEIRFKRAELQLLDEGLVDVDSAKLEAARNEVEELRKCQQELLEQRDQLEAQLTIAKSHLEAAKALFKELLKRDALDAVPESPLTSAVKARQMCRVQFIHRLWRRMDLRIACRGCHVQTSRLVATRREQCHSLPDRMGERTGGEKRKV
ncbi:hypothetical protein CBR_g46677 [Chara braunii]|uniref:Uncharacterized protein n=1 Tax=Chara braunii TaxID=69332 RepID=A0A388M129_CHABU|nr:hypothetical protein CBR_g46677 [Chara braunii]|eukprot:GBG88189.1 hypothetical protein CBR_g46677 [Chara braunii]